MTWSIKRTCGAKQNLSGKSRKKKLSEKQMKPGSNKSIEREIGTHHSIALTARTPGKRPGHMKIQQKKKPSKNRKNLGQDGIENVKPIKNGNASGNNGNVSNNNNLVPQLILLQPGSH